MEGVAVVGGSHVAAVHVLAVTFVYHDAVAYFHYSPLYSLQFVACTRHLQQQEEVHHGVAGGLALPHPDGLYEYLVKTGSLA